MVPLIGYSQNHTYTSSLKEDLHMSSCKDLDMSSAASTTITFSILSNQTKNRYNARRPSEMVVATYWMHSLHESSPGLSPIWQTYVYTEAIKQFLLTLQSMGGTVCYRYTQQSNMVT